MAGLLVTVGIGCSPQGAERRGTTVLYASGADLQSINPLLTVHPLAKAVQKHILLMTLASYDSAFQAAPRLASWVWGDGGDELTFRIRQDVRWHDGVPTTAHDVRFTVDMARDPRVAYPRARDLEAVREVLVVDSFVVRVRFARPQPTFPDVFTDLAILPAHQFVGVTPGAMRVASFNSTPVGNGPFRFVEHRANQRWIFQRVDGFPSDLGVPDVERFVVVVVDEATTKLAALTSGELDFAGISPAHAEFVRSDPRLEIIDYPVQFVFAIMWNMRREPFRDVRVRHALTQALDRDGLVQAFLYGFGSVADGPVPPAHPWYLPVASESVDREAAMRLLDEAGLPPGPTGTRLRFDLLTVAGDAALEQMIQAQLAAVGVDVRIRQLELSTFLARAQAPEREFDAVAIGVPGDFSLGYVRALFEGTEPGPLAYSGHEDDRFDDAMERAREAGSEAELREAWYDAQRVLLETRPTTWLYHARGLQGATGRIANTSIDLRGELANIAAWRFTERRDVP